MLKQEAVRAEANVLFLLFQQLRPKQWTKNLLVFAALIFSFQVANVDLLIRSVAGFLLFCFVSGCVYILNDFVDREADRQHPEKRDRPMASGALNPYLALSFGFVLLLAAIAVGLYLEPLFGVLLIVYFAINVAYSFRLKHVVIIDVMIIASGFVFRAIGGALVIDVPFTPWFLLCTMLLALFLAISKRRHELYLLQNNKGSHRKVLESYSPELLNQLNSIVITATIMSYALYTFTSGHTIHLMWTIPLVIYGIFRYLYLILMEEKGGKPERDLFQDKHILITVLLYGLAVVVILNYFE
ncbi:decaprenyl-phosphate phosphoribosyltransferase [Tumebacillus algifaecis]|uniref:Decaprenyl-phosphate phosphoribosyltransferase n=1 Tax=Tumebacillus algifaecis TaxID=1214604 RepID=A0A223CX62_9BACL|nr:decaprenyl-phosphate phosphoribosyltransferase [Tumebacillus algifaecis]ASS73892.1 decaprenyl-phosphate phosphoribosyltransferase [Tumebacillus algifaecis]